MRRDIGRHTDGDSRAAVDQQVGQPGRQHHRLLQAGVKVGHKVNRILVNIKQHLLRDGRQTCLGIAHRRRRVVVHTAEVALAVNQHVAHGEVLRHAHHGVVDRGVTVGVVFTQHLTDHPGALLVRAGVDQPQLAHGIENAPVHRLEAVAHVGQRPRHDDAHGIVQVGAFHLLFDIDRSGIAGNH